MVKRWCFLLALALAIGACEAEAFADPSIAGVGDVQVLGIRSIPPNVVLATVTLTNGTAHDMTPAIERFFLTSSSNARYAGIDSGSSAFVGVSNPHRMLKHGEKRDYTVGFRTTDPVVAGTVSYEP